MSIFVRIFFISLSLMAFDVRAFDMDVIKDEISAPVVEVEPDDFYGNKEKLLLNASDGKLYGHMYTRPYNNRKFEDEFPNQMYGILSNDYGLKIDFSGYMRNQEVTWCSSFVNQKISQVIYSLSEATFYNKFEPGVSFKNQVIQPWDESPYKFLDEMEDQSHKSQLMSNFQGSYSSVVEDCSGSDDGKKFLAAFRAFLQDLGGAMDGYVKDQHKLMVAERDEVMNKKNAEQAASKSRGEQVRECLSGSAYNLYVASSLVDGENKKIANARRQLNKQDEIGRVSGAVNLSEKNRLGEVLVNAKALRSKYFADYKKYGGAAVLPEKVLVLENPCKN